MGGWVHQTKSRHPHSNPQASNLLAFIEVRETMLAVAGWVGWLPAIWWVECGGYVMGGWEGCTDCKIFSRAEILKLDLEWQQKFLN